MQIFWNNAHSLFAISKIGVVHSLVQSPVDPQIVFFVGSENIHWVSENCGKTIKALNVGRGIFDFKFHMLEKKWMLASTINTCEDSDDKKCKRSQELYVSQDLGETWKFLSDNVIQFSW